MQRVRIGQWIVDVFTDNAVPKDIVHMHVRFSSELNRPAKVFIKHEIDGSMDGAIDPIGPTPVKIGETDLTQLEGPALTEAAFRVRHVLVNKARKEVIRVLRNNFDGGKIPAIKAYKDITGIGLKEAKETVEQIMREDRICSHPHGIKGETCSICGGIA